MSDPSNEQHLGNPRAGMPTDADLGASHSARSVDGPAGATAAAGAGYEAAANQHPPPQWPPPRPTVPPTPASQRPVSPRRAPETGIEQTTPRRSEPIDDPFQGSERPLAPRRHRSTVPTSTKIAFLVAGLAIIFLVANQFRVPEDESTIGADVGSTETAEPDESTGSTTAEEDGDGEEAAGPAVSSEAEGEEEAAGEAGEAQAPQAEAEQPTENEPTTSVTSDPNWPGGTGPVPPGGPLPRRALITPTGRMVLTGSAPSWDTVTRIVKLAGEKLPAGVNSVDNNISWHPDADPSINWNQVVMVNAANFGAGGSEIVPGSLDGLDVAAQILLQHPTSFAVVVGHSDNSGDEEVNAELAVDRAEAVIDYLSEQGVEAEQIVVASAGADDPLVSNETEAGRAENRRVEIQFKDLLVPSRNPAGG